MGNHLQKKKSTSHDLLKTAWNGIAIVFSTIMGVAMLAMFVIAKAVWKSWPLIVLGLLLYGFSVLIS